MDPNQKKQQEALMSALSECRQLHGFTGINTYLEQRATNPQSFVQMLEEVVTALNNQGYAITEKSP